MMSCPGRLLSSYCLNRYLLYNGLIGELIFPPRINYNFCTTSDIIARFSSNIVVYSQESKFLHRFKY